MLMMYSSLPSTRIARTRCCDILADALCGQRAILQNAISEHPAYFEIKATSRSPDSMTAIGAAWCTNAHLYLATGVHLHGCTKLSCCFWQKRAVVPVANNSIATNS